MLLKSKSEQERRLLTALVNKVSYLFLHYATPFYLFSFFLFQYMQNCYDLDWKQQKIKYIIILFMSNIA
jgi:hypothetical protein